jgi:hypothetical protein
MARPRFANLDLDTRFQVLETAAVEFAARGYDGVSLNQLIERDLFSTVADLAWAIVLPVEALDLETLDASNYWFSLEALMREARARVRANPWLVGFTRLMYDPPDIPGVRESLSEKFDEARRWQAELIRRGQTIGTVRADLPVELLQALLVGADEAGDRWFVNNWEQLDEREIERLFEEVFAIFRRMLEAPRKR